MPAAVRLGDSCDGACGSPPRPNIQGSENVFTNSKPQHRLTDGWAGHLHKGNAASGSPDVFVNSLPACRVGDKVSCGSNMAQGSPNVYING